MRLTSNDTYYQMLCKLWRRLAVRRTIPSVVASLKSVSNQVNTGSAGYINQANQPLITTIIPTYQRPQLLRCAIQSVLDQTYANFQVCVYDNASGDETAGG